VNTIKALETMSLLSLVEVPPAYCPRVLNNRKAHQIIAMEMHSTWIIKDVPSQLKDT
jgi:hypothetical protein